MVSVCLVIITCKLCIIHKKSLYLQLSVSNATQVYLRDVGFNLSGNLSCEITTDGPLYKTAIVSKRIIVVGKYNNNFYEIEINGYLLCFKNNRLGFIYTLFQNLLMVI